MAITSVQVLSVPVSDQEAAKEFYVDKLGLELRRDVPMGEGARWVEVAPEGAATSMVLVTWIPEMTPGSVHGLVLLSNDVDEECERLGRQGVEVTGPEDYPWGRQAILEDPDGNGLVISGPLAKGV